ncbi:MULTISPECIES: DsbC family protein [unclassified Thioalkalivibrio]|uniref:DsbC family protein n=1 Tax=unclassified Thioalkalivibrio TaxID=2621013 RepID=UPI000373B6EC|nr:MULTISPECIES: DsbC family protein [unclassified Thioalkalivibrio]
MSLLSSLSRDATPDRVVKSPIAGLYEAHYGADILYVDAAGEHVIEGPIHEPGTGRNLTKESANSIRRDLFDRIPESEMVIFEPSGDVNGQLTVFTDPACPYCQALHGDLWEYMDAGIRIRYLMYPLVGRDSPELMDAIWCSDDPTRMMNRAKSSGSRGANLRADASCDSPRENHIALGKALGVTATPAVVTHEGDMLQGYAPAHEMIDRMGPMEP